MILLFLGDIMIIEYLFAYINVVVAKMFFEMHFVLLRSWPIALSWELIGLMVYFGKKEKNAATLESSIT